MPKPTLPAALLAAVLATAAQAESATYTVDPSHTHVTWEVVHMGTSTLRANFTAKEGTVTLDRAAKTGKADISLDLASLAGTDKSLEGMLRGERGFNVAGAPTARFVADSFGFDGDKLATVNGTLSLLGKSQPVTLRAQRFNCYTHPMLKREVCGGDFEAKVSRSAFGLGMVQQFVSDEVGLLVQVEAIRQQ